MTRLNDTASDKLFQASQALEENLIDKVQNDKEALKQALEMQRALVMKSIEEMMVALAISVDGKSPDARDLEAFKKVLQNATFPGTRLHEIVAEKVKKVSVEHSGIAQHVKDVVERGECLLSYIKKAEHALAEAEQNQNSDYRDGKNILASQAIGLVCNTAAILSDKLTDLRKEMPVGNTTSHDSQENTNSKSAAAKTDLLSSVVASTHDDEKRVKQQILEDAKCQAKRFALQMVITNKLITFSEGLDRRVADDTEKTNIERLVTLAIMGELELKTACERGFQTLGLRGNKLESARKEVDALVDLVEEVKRTVPKKISTEEALRSGESSIAAADGTPPDVPPVPAVRLGN